MAQSTRRVITAVLLMLVIGMTGSLGTCSFPGGFDFKFDWSFGWGNGGGSPGDGDENPGGPPGEDPAGDPVAEQPPPQAPSPPPGVPDWSSAGQPGMACDTFCPIGGPHAPTPPPAPQPDGGLIVGDYSGIA